MLKARTENDIDYHVDEVRKRRNKLKVEDKEFKVSDLDTRINEIIKDLKNIANNDLEDMVLRLKLTYDKILDIFDVEFLAASPVGYTLHLVYMKLVVLI